MGSIMGYKKKRTNPESGNYAAYYPENNIFNKNCT